MENRIFDLLTKIKNEEFAKITYFAEMDEKNEKFVDYEYFAIEKGGIFFYIQNATITDMISRIYKPFTITAYRKHDFMHKQQLALPVGFETYEELKEIVLKDIEKLKDKIPLKDTHKQTMHYDLLTYHQTEYGKITLFDYLKKIAGYRELEILKNIDYVTMNINNNKYCVLEFYNKNGQSFAINTKNINRLIIS